MNNQQFYILSGGVGEIYLDRVDRHWYRHESTDHAKEKVIPFFKFLYELIGVRATITDIIKISTKIIKNFKII